MRGVRKNLIRKKIKKIKRRIFFYDFKQLVQHKTAENDVRTDTANIRKGLKSEGVESFDIFLRCATGT